MSVAVEERDLLRFLTAGSVDDGKSTLIGRLLYESSGVYDDQLSSVRKASAAKHVELDLSLITDGLRAEREQGITIDVAYRYFSTKHRKFIVADVPGHEQYTRNMATGASTAQLALILMDARKGLLPQTRRHALIAWLLGIRQMIVAVNKMDLVSFDRQAFSSLRDDFQKFSAVLRGAQLHFVPLSALTGDNVIGPSVAMPWYGGNTLLGLLETLPIERPLGEAFRFPVQNVIRPNQDFRGYAGQVVSGMIKVGQEVVALPSRQRTRIREIYLYDRNLHEAVPLQSVVLTTTDHIDLGRGDMLVAPEHPPVVSSKPTAYVIWLSHTCLLSNARYLVKHATRTLCASFRRLNHKIDINTMESIDTETLQFNEIGEVQLELDSPIACDAYEQNRTTGSFIVIDPFTNDTVAAGMIVKSIRVRTDEIFDVSENVRLAQRRGLTVWFTGLSGAGKTTICRAVATELLARGLEVEVIDGDVIRNHLCKDLGFSKHDRNENIRRISFVAQLLTRNGTVVLVSAISPYRAGREEARRTIGDFLEVYVNTPLAVCEVRDPKLLYKKARLGEIHGFTGVDDPYESPLAAEILCDTSRESTRTSSSKVVSAVLNYLSSRDPLE